MASGKWQVAKKIRIDFLYIREECFEELVFRHFQIGMAVREVVADIGNVAATVVFFVHVVRVGNHGDKRK